MCICISAINSALWAEGFYPDSKVLEAACIWLWSIEGTPVECANGDESLTSARRHPHHFHQTVMEKSQSKATSYIREVVAAQHYARHAYQDSPQHQQNAERNREHQVSQQELGHHNCPTCMSCWKGVDIHGQVVQESGGYLEGSFTLHQLLHPRHSHYVQ